MTGKKILNVLQGQIETVPPVWLMRQAGRYLPEYQKIRAQAGNFLDLVFNPEWACEVTLQPIRRYGFDAAILFSDILVVPQALHCAVRFEEGEGPRLQAVNHAFIENLDVHKADLSIFDPVFETVERISHGLKDEGFNDTALIGFAGSPWTVACYMIDGGGSKDFTKSLFWVKNSPEDLQKLIDALVDVTVAYLVKQIASGAEIIQLFDSWSGLLTEEEDFRRWVIEPTKKIVGKLKGFYPSIPVIGFPRGAGPHYMIYAAETGVHCLGLDQHVTMNKARRYQSLLPVQGNLAPEVLVSGEDLEKNIETIISSLAEGPHIFNLGHGIIKETPPENVTRLVNFIRK
ncbi:MAG: uroporphyrinogen decarboxylase [Micavibrio sp.]